MRYLPNGNWMQKADTRTIQEIGIPSLVLMERAALQAVEAMEQEKVDLRKVLVIAGSGNNGGDGFAVARLLYQKGNDVAVMFAGNEKSMSEECRIQRRITENIGIETFTELPEEEYTVIIDALFGVGLCRDITGSYAEVIDWMNRQTGWKIAIDIPSGISAATGQVLGTAFRADLTVSFQCEKLGTVLYPGQEYAGKTIAAEIGIDTAFYEKIPEICYTLDPEDLPELLPARKSDSHKGTYGKVLMITGSKGMAGAAYLSAKAAYICGAGLVQIYTHEQNRTILQQLLPEAIISTYEAYSEQELKSLLEWADAVCIGCGLGQSDISASLLRGTLTFGKVPCVIDADGLNLLASYKEYLLHNPGREIILTPHMKEMSGLLGCSVQELKKERFSMLNTFIAEYPVICALKDARTVVAGRNRRNFVNTAGNSAMAKAGSGDVLSGVITALLAQHMSAYDAAVTGVYLHARGGDEAQRMLGSYSVLAEDLIRGIGQCLQKAEYSYKEENTGKGSVK